MERPATPIHGYRQLSEIEIAYINLIKTMENSVGSLFNQLEKEHPELDKRWFAIARTDIQQGFMALARSIAKPDSRLNPPAPPQAKRQG